MDAAPPVLKSIARTTKQLKKVLERVSDPSIKLTQKEATDASQSKRMLRKQLRDLFVTLILNHRAVSARMGAEENLWKMCFYKRMVELRSAVRRQETARDNAARSSKSSQAADGRADVREERAERARRELMKFLAEGSAFFQRVLLRFQDIRRANPTDDLAR